MTSSGLPKKLVTKPYSVLALSASTSEMERKSDSGVAFWEISHRCQIYHSSWHQSHTYFRALTKSELSAMCASITPAPLGAVEDPGGVLDAASREPREAERATVDMLRFERRAVRRIPSRQ